MVFMGSLFIFFFFLVTPIRIEFEVQHRQHWTGTLVIRYFFFQHAFSLEKHKVEQSNLETEIYWQEIMPVFFKVSKHIPYWIFVKQCKLDCAIGFKKPTTTAYAYGMVWALFSILPQWWKEHLEVDYLPVFDQAVKKVDLDSIIMIPLGNLIAMMSYTLWLVAGVIWEHKRRERLVYEG